MLGQSLPKLSLSWANYHVPGGSGGTEEETVVCCAKEEGRAGQGGWGGFLFITRIICRICITIVVLTLRVKGKWGWGVDGGCCTGW